MEREGPECGDLVVEGKHGSLGFLLVYK
jgi:hypothetical protein